MSIKHLSDEDQLYIYGLLRTNRLIGQIWPVYRWDNHPKVYGLLFSEPHAYQELAAVSDTQFTPEQFKTVLAKYNVAPYPSPFSKGKSAEERLIKAFYESRKDRRIAA